MSINNIVIFHLVKKYTVKEAYMQELHMVLKSLFLGTHVTPFGPFK